MMAAWCARHPRRRPEPRSRPGCRKADCGRASRCTSRTTMTNYLARAALAALLSSPAWCAGDFIAPRAAAVPGGVVTFKLPATKQKPAVRYGDLPVLVVRQSDGWLA